MPSIKPQLPRLPIFDVLHVTAAAAAVLFISNGASAVRRVRPSVRRTGVYAARTPPCPAHATAGAAPAAAPDAAAAALHLSKKRKKLFFRRLSYLEQTRSLARNPPHGRADQRTDERTDARTWEAPHRDIAGHRQRARMQPLNEHLAQIVNYIVIRNE